ncbi:saccharopine dehydrogenase family protein [Natronosalvus vescus]|uniref:saccharopine dehydrogenase family protein n=1 Tax=Natronosalvus vescus TaxID=2953881 RepID=UPI0020901405|nr:saccharopine dehydrogenase NADP-binding domain-containing protein [Natronosalvus vescus]
MDGLLIYGAYGYTGSLIAREAVAHGGSPVLAGRDGEQVRTLATSLDLDYRVFDVETDDPTDSSERDDSTSASDSDEETQDTTSLVDQLEPFDVVCNCAGPFVHTAEPMVEACLDAGTDYLDINAEFQVFERLASMDERATDADVTVLPGIGFDVVTSDCLAAFLASKLPDATELSLGIATSSTVSRGTAKTMVESLGSGGIIRRRGRLVEVPTAHDTRDIDFGSEVGVKPAMTVPWGDVVTAAHSTDIDSVRVYAASTRRTINALKAGAPLESLAEFDPVKSTLERLVEATMDGPDGSELTTGRAVVWGEVTNGTESVTGRLSTPNPYSFTAESVVLAAEKTLAGEVESGYQTPATAFDHDFVLECSDVQRVVKHSHPQSTA